MTKKNVTLVKNRKRLRKRVRERKYAPSSRFSSVIASGDMKEQDDSKERIGRRVTDTERLKPFLQAVGSYSPELIFGVKQQLFHYTDLSGFQSIVTNHDLWLSHLRYSNDEEEMVHGQRLVMEVIDDKRKAARSSKRIAFLDRVRHELSQQVDVYICCFCLQDDLLSQWRGYGANGSGHRR